MATRSKGLILGDIHEHAWEDHCWLLTAALLDGL